MKNFLRIIAIIFLLVVAFTVIKAMKKEVGTPSSETVTSTEDEVPTEENSTEESTESLEEIVEASSPSDGVVILGGDGISNN